MSAQAPCGRTSDPLPCLRNSGRASSSTALRSNGSAGRVNEVAEGKAIQQPHGLAQHAPQRLVRRLRDHPEQPPLALEQPPQRLRDREHDRAMGHVRQRRRPQVLGEEERALRRAGGAEVARPAREREQLRGPARLAVKAPSELAPDLFRPLDDLTPGLDSPERRWLFVRTKEIDDAARTREISSRFGTARLHLVACGPPYSVVTDHPPGPR